MKTSWVEHDGLGRGDASLPPVSGPLDEGGLDVPNCPFCLHRMRIAETDLGELYWACTSCGQAKLA